MRKVQFAIFITIVFFVATSAYAATLTSTQITQTAQDGDALYTFFDVADETGEAVVGLSAENVTLTIGTKTLETELQTVAQAQLGVGYVFAVDISKSLNAKQFESVQKALLQWISNMGEKDHAAILTFGEEIAVLTDFTQDTNMVVMAAEKISPTDNKTQLYSGILRALDIANRQSPDLPVRRVVVVLSDGIDDFPAGATEAEVASKARESGVPMYIVGVKAKNNQKELNELGGIARTSGGGLYLASEDALQSGYQQVYTRIQNGYVAKSKLDHTVADGALQGLHLTVRQGRMSVENSVDIRPKALPALPAPSAKPSPSIRPIATSAPTVPESIPEPKPSVDPELIQGLIIAACALGVVGGVLYLITTMKLKKKRKREAEKQAKLLEEQKLVDGITEMPGVSRHKPVQNGEDETERLGGTYPSLDVTEKLNTTGNQLMLALSNVGTARQYTAPLRNEVRVGRLRNKNDIEIEDNAISGQHCIFLFRDERLYLKDCGSSNGTYILKKKKKNKVNTECVQVEKGDIICIGKTELELDIFLR